MGYEDEYQCKQQKLAEKRKLKGGRASDQLNFKEM